MIGPPRRANACDAICPKVTVFARYTLQSDQPAGTDFQILGGAFHDLTCLTKDLIANLERRGENDPSGHVGDAARRRLPILRRAVTVG